MCWNDPKKNRVCVGTVFELQIIKSLTKTLTNKEFFGKDGLKKCMLTVGPTQTFEDFYFVEPPPTEEGLKKSPEMTKKMIFQVP